MIYRTVSCETWGDPWFADLPAPCKLVFLYLFTNSRTSAAGVYEITTRQIAFDTGLDEDRVCEMLRVDLAGKVCWWPDLRIVWVCNFFKRQQAQSNSNNFAMGARRALRVFPQHVQEAVYAFYPELAPITIPPLPSLNGSASHPHPTPIPSPSLGDKETVTVTGSVTVTESESIESDTQNPAPTGAKAPKSRGERLPDRFLLTGEMRKWAATNTPSVDVTTETAAFCDYWRSVPGAKGCKLDWPATWRNWMRTEQKKLTRSTSLQKTGGTPYAKPSYAEREHAALSDAARLINELRSPGPDPRTAGRYGGVIDADSPDEPPPRPGLRLVEGQSRDVG